jgi:putative transcriptional regulator
VVKAVISNTIRQLRFEHGEMTQQELADAAGCTRQTIIMLEQGRYVPSLALALKISEIFDTPVEDIFTLEKP